MDNNDVKEALALLKAGRLQESLSRFKQLAQDHPDDERFVSNIGLILSRQGKARKAIPYYQRAIQMCPENPLYQHNLANALYLCHEYEQALAVFREIVAQHPQRTSSWNDMAVLLNRMGRTEEAVAALQSAVNADPNYVNGWHNLGVYLGRLMRTDEAIAAYSEAVRIAPCAWRTRDYLALAYAMNKLYDKAVAEYEFIAAQQPHYKDIHLQIADVYELAGHYGRAIDAYNHHLQLFPGDAQGLSKLGMCQLTRGLEEKSIAICREGLRTQWKAVRRRPWHILVWLNLFLTYHCISVKLKK